MADDPADALTDYMLDRARDGFDAIGAELEERFRELVSVPVEKDGSKIIRSKPGEPPRLETQSYQESFRHVTSVDGDTVRTEAGTSDPRGEWFTAGTSRMKPRPHANIVREEFVADGEDRISQALSNQ